MLRFGRQLRARLVEIDDVQADARFGQHVTPYEIVPRRESREARRQ